MRTQVRSTADWLPYSLIPGSVGLNRNLVSSTHPCARPGIRLGYERSNSEPTRDLVSSCDGLRHRRLGQVLAVCHELYVYRCPGGSDLALDFSDLLRGVSTPAV